MTLHRIRREFGSTVALDDVSIEIPDGEFLVLLGPSGCGKSTLLRIIAGLLPPSGGRVIVDERDVTSLPPGDRDIAMVFQSYALYPHLTVERNLGFGLRVRHRTKAEIAEKVGAVADQLKLTSLLGRRPKELSGGQRQRVALGRAMVRDPKAFLMDEPLSNLDAQLRTATRLELAELHRRLGTTFVYVTHDQVEAMTMATRIAILDHGRLEQIGTPAEVYDEPATTFVAGFIGAPPMNLLPATALGIGDKVHVIAEGVDVELADGDLEERDVVLGVRPEHLRFAREEHTGPNFRGTVLAVENLGSEEVAFCAVGNAQIAVRGPRPLRVEPGDDVTLTAALSRVYLFDPTSTRRLLWVDDGAGDRGRTFRAAVGSSSTT
ncbi:MAG: transporter related protein [Acidimicrobiaceae bacterium]|nr:transporter related protein [Acidimicrobiaceae bacterium]